MNSIFDFTLYWAQNMAGGNQPSGTIVVQQQQNKPASSYWLYAGIAVALFVVFIVVVKRKK